MDIRKQLRSSERSRNLSPAPLTWILWNSKLEFVEQTVFCRPASKTIDSRDEKSLPSSLWMPKESTDLAHVVPLGVRTSKNPTNLQVGQSCCWWAQKWGTNRFETIDWERDLELPTAILSLRIFVLYLFWHSNDWCHQFDGFVWARERQRDQNDCG